METLTSEEQTVLNKIADRMYAELKFSAFTYMTKVGVTVTFRVPLTEETLKNKPWLVSKED